MRRSRGGEWLGVGAGLSLKQKLETHTERRDFSVGIRTGVRNSRVIDDPRHQHLRTDHI